MPTASVIIDKIGSWTEALKQRYWGTVARSLRFLGTFRVVIFRVALVFHLPLSNGIQCPCRNTVSPERSSSGFLSGHEATDSHACTSKRAMPRFAHATISLAPSLLFSFAARRIKLDARIRLDSTQTRIDRGFGKRFGIKIN